MPIKLAYLPPSQIDLVSGKIGAPMRVGQPDVSIRVGVGGIAAYSGSAKAGTAWRGVATSSNYTIISVLRDSAGRGVKRHVVDADHLGVVDRIFQLALSTTNTIEFTPFINNSTPHVLLGTNTIPSDRPVVVAARTNGTEVSVWLNGAKEASSAASSLAPIKSTDVVGVCNIVTTVVDNPFSGDLYGAWIVDGAVSDAVLSAVKSPADAWRLLFDPQRIVVPMSDADSSAADTNTPTDSAVSVSARLSVATDTNTPTDSAVSTTTRLSVANDTNTPTDSAVSVSTRLSVATDTNTPTDSAVASVTTAGESVASDTNTPTDSAVSVSARLSVATDTNTPTDSAVSVSTRLSVATDTNVPTDSTVAERPASIEAVAVDSVIFTDSAVASNGPEVIAELGHFGEEKNVDALKVIRAIQAMEDDTIIEVVLMLQLSGVLKELV